MTAFELAFSQVDQFTEQYGIDIRPVIQVWEEKERLQNFFAWTCSKYPGLFEKLEMSQREFQIKKLFQFPGKGQVELPTMTLTARGPVIIFHHKLSVFKEEISWDNPDRIFQDCLVQFCRTLPTHKPVRVGLVSELVFNTGDANACGLLASCMPRFRNTNPSDVFLTLKYKRDGKNINIHLQPVQAVQVQPAASGGAPPPGVRHYGLQVKLDINNEDITRPLDQEQIAGILYFARAYAKNDLLPLLNGGLANAAD
jgi:hypothetical protein